MRRMSKLKILLLAGVMGMSLPITSMASPEFSRTAGEWSSLRDNVLEYGEIADLIHEYNVTVQNNRYEYNEFIKDYGKKKDDVAQAYRDLADDLEAEKSGDDSAMSRVSDLQLDIQAKQLREQADDNLEDSEIHYLSYSQAEDNLVLSAQSKFISYYKNQLELEAAEAQKKTLENTETLTAAKRQAGMATEADVLSAQESVLEQEKTISGLKQEIERTRQELIIMLGWKGSDQPEITGLPDNIMAELDSIDLQADQETALEKNYTLRINRKKLENADDADSKAKIKNTISGNERQIEVSVTNAWEGLQTGKLSYEQAVSDAAAEARNMEQAVQKWSAGMITRYDYEQQQAALTKKELAVKTAELNLIDLLETYRWNVNGLASAE
ncbi:outer membrane efflux protein [Hungatella effluvii]|uniref:Outer membrane efflux protein n=1 Tax=Hungatella effluvii TaxID=1096246 RepID=A0A2V3Y9H2_9FIRM|nr:TolC family protein [Hungatella effluvii]PXX55818.1 outer membrane efflux protein [Hungatella effluvii]